MQEQVKEKYNEEVSYQVKMLNNLKRWLNVLMIFSSVCLIFMIFGTSIHTLIKPISLVLFVISVVCLILVGWGYKKGRDNVSKFLDYIEVNSNK